MVDLSRIEVFCEDKNLGKVLRSLTGLAIGEPKVQPVINANVKANGIVPATNGELVSLFAKHLSEKKINEFGPELLRSFVQSVGRPESAYTQLRNDAQKYGLIKMTGHGRMTRYRVTMVNYKNKGKRS